MPQVNEKNEALNKILGRMWELNNRLAQGHTLTKEHTKFYNRHLPTIQSYYTTHNQYWQLQVKIPEQ